MLVMLILLISSIFGFPLNEAEDGEEPELDDSDGDGLTDEEEEIFGTHPEMKDTDEDGISDYDEIYKWKTNPTRESTDGDRYDDGMEIFGHSPVGLGEFGGDMPGYVLFPGNDVFAAAFPDIDIEISNSINVETRNITTEERGQETSKTNTYTTTTRDGSSLTVGTEESHTFGEWQQTHNREYDEEISDDYRFQLGEGSQIYIQGHNLGVSVTTEEGTPFSITEEDVLDRNGKVTPEDLASISQDYVSSNQPITEYISPEVWQWILENFYTAPKQVLLYDYIEDEINRLEYQEIGAEVFWGLVGIGLNTLVPGVGSVVGVVGGGVSAILYKLTIDHLEDLLEVLENKEIYIRTHELNSWGLTFKYTVGLGLAIPSFIQSLVTSKPGFFEKILPNNYIKIEGIEQHTQHDYNIYDNYEPTAGSVGATKDWIESGNMPITSHSENIDIGDGVGRHIVESEWSQGTNEESTYRTTETYSTWHETTVTETETNKITNSWSTATAVDSSYAGELDFTFFLKNIGTDIAREIDDLRFNIFIGDSAIPKTYPPSKDEGISLSNLLPGSKIQLAANDIVLSLEEMMAIDEGASIKIQVAYYSFGEDQLYYENALGKCVLFHIDDGVSDGDESIDKYLIATWGVETYLDVLARLLPVEFDENFILKSIDNKSIDEQSYWNIKLTEHTDTNSFVYSLAEPRTRIFMVYYHDSDGDRYNDRTEMELGTDSENLESHPSPIIETTMRYDPKKDGNTTIYLKIANTGNYPAYGIESRIFSVNGNTTIIDGFIGGEGYIGPGEKLLLKDDVFVIDGDPYSDNLSDLIGIIKYNSPHESKTSILPASLEHTYSRMQESTTDINLLIDSPELYHYDSINNISIVYEHPGNMTSKVVNPNWDSSVVTSWDYSSNDQLLRVAVSADGEYLVGGSKDDSIYLFKKNSDEPLWEYEAEDDILSVAISADGEYIVVGSNDKNIYLFHKDSNVPMWKNITPNAVRSVAISADGDYIASGGYDGKVRFFSREESEPLWQYETNSWVYDIAMSGEGDYLVAGCYDGGIHFFDTSNGIREWKYNALDEITYVDISMDGEFIVVGSWDEHVYLYGNDGTLLLDYNTDESGSSDSRVQTVAISDDGNFFVAGCIDRVAYLFKTATKEVVWSFNAGDEITYVDISSNGRFIAVGTSANDKNVYVFNKDSNGPIWSKDVNSRINEVSFSSMGEILSLGTDDNKIHTFNANDAGNGTYRLDAISNSTLMYAFMHLNGSIIYQDSIVHNFSVGMNYMNFTWVPADHLQTDAYGRDIKLMVKMVDSQSYLIYEGIERFTVHDDRPDLFVYQTNMTFSNDDPVLGEPVNITTTIYNLGDTEAVGMNVSFYLGDPNNESNLIEERSIPSILANASVDISIELDDLKIGDNSIYVIVDSNDSIEEVIEGNNIAQSSIYVRYKPDLVISNSGVLFSEDVIYQSQEVLMNITAKNHGDVDAIDVLLRLVIDGEITEFIDMGDIPYDESVSVSFNWSATPGERTLEIILDPNDTIAESNEDNNLLTIPFTVYTIADIIPTAIQFSDPSPTSGDVITINTLIENIGSLNAEDIKVRILVDDYLLEQSTVNNIQANQEKGIWVDWTAISGWHTITVIVNLDDDVEESNTTNNILNDIIFVAEPQAEKPKADAGEDATTYTNDPVPMIGTGYDSDGEIIHYEWDFDGDGEYEWSSSDTGVTQHTYSTTGTFVAQFKVTDDEGSNSTDLKVVRVIDEPEPENLRPIADAGEDVTIFEDEMVTFLGSGYDLDGTIELYQWDLDGDGTYDWSSTSTGVTENSYPTVGSFVTRFMVTDDGGSTAIDFKVVRVISETLPDNMPPIADAGSDITVEIGIPAVLVGSAIDPDGDIVLFEWDYDDDGVFDWNDPNHGITMKNFSTPGYHVLTLQVTDNRGATSKDMVLVNVLDETQVDNTPPAANAGVDQQGQVGEAILFSGDGIETDGTIVLFEWDFDGDGTYDWNGTDHGVAKHTFDAAEVYIATLRVTDDLGATDTDVCVIQVDQEADEPNTLPVAEIQNDVKVNVNQATTLNGLGYDSDGTIVKYEWDFDGDGIFDWNGTGSGVVQHTYTKAGVYYAKLRVTDDEGASDTEVCEVIVTAPSDSNDDGPGFGSLVAITALCLVAVVWRRKKQLAE